jgi:hypothetical protein
MMFNNFSFKGFLLAVMTCGVLFYTASYAYALRIIPPRLVIKSNQNIEYVFIKNNSNKVESYRFGWKRFAMDHEGNIVNLDKEGAPNVPGYKAADDFIRYSPRRATLNPGETQRVTLLINRPPTMEAGEYRSHFFVQRVPDNKTSANQHGITPVAGSAVDIDLLVSRSFPVYVMSGDVSATLSLVSARLVTERGDNNKLRHQVYFNVEKDGNRSVIGKEEVFCGSGEGALKVSKAPKVFAVYAEGKKREEKTVVGLPENGCPDMRIVIHAHQDDLLDGAFLAEGQVAQ